MELPPSEQDALRLALDADVHVAAAEALRLRGFDVVSLREVGREAMPDEAQLHYAAGQQRSILTFNVGDFSELHVRWLAEGRHHAGIVVSAQIPLREFLRRCYVLLSLYTPTMLRDQLIWLPRA